MKMVGRNNRIELWKGMSMINVMIKIYKYLNEINRMLKVGKCFYLIYSIVSLRYVHFYEIIDMILEWKWFVGNIRL